MAEYVLRLMVYKIQIEKLNINTEAEEDRETYYWSFACKRDEQNSSRIFTVRLSKSYWRGRLARADDQGVAG